MEFADFHLNRSSKQQYMRQMKTKFSCCQIDLLPQNHLLPKNNLSPVYFSLSLSVNTTLFSHLVHTCFWISLLCIPMFCSIFILSRPRVLFLSLSLSALSLHLSFIVYLCITIWFYFCKCFSSHFRFLYT